MNDSDSAESQLYNYLKIMKLCKKWRSYTFKPLMVKNWNAKKTVILLHLISKHLIQSNVNVMRIKCD